MIQSRWVWAVSSARARADQQRVPQSPSLQTSRPGGAGQLAGSENVLRHPAEEAQLPPKTPNLNLPGARDRAKARLHGARKLPMKELSHYHLHPTGEETEASSLACLHPGVGGGARPNQAV